MTTAHKFNLKLEEIPVTLTRADGTDWACVLREMDGTSRDLFLNSQKTKIRMATREVLDFKDLHTSLLAKCLVDVSEDKLVPETEIRKFPAKVQSQLYTICTDLNALSEKAETEVKND